MIDREAFALRCDALAVAEGYKDKILEKYPPEQFSDNLTPSTVFNNPVKRTVTPLGQAVDSMLTIADWLVQE